MWIEIKTPLTEYEREIINAVTEKQSFFLDDTSYIALSCDHRVGWFSETWTIWATKKMPAAPERGLTASAFVESANAFLDAATYLTPVTKKEN